MDKVSDIDISQSDPERGAALKLTQMLERLIGHMALCLSDDVERRLSQMRENETEKNASKIYECMFDNLAAARRDSRPFCQDTGILHFYVKAGASFKLLPLLNEIVMNAAIGASKSVPLRPNAVMPFSDRNTGDNIGPCSPFIHWELAEGDLCEITVYMAGGGSSLPGFARVFTPSEGYGAIEDLVAETVRTKGVNSCPPLIVGVGIGASMDVAAELSKKALLRECGSFNPDPGAAEMEKRLFERLNNMRIGPGGTGGTESVLAVHVEAAVHHPATLAAAASFGCWATRKGTLAVDAEGNGAVTSHRELLPEKG